MSGQQQMTTATRTISFLCFLLVLAAPGFGDKKQPEIEVPYEPTPPQVVEQMLKLAKVTEADMVYDLGCGDGRIVIAAAQKYKAHGFGVDLDPQRIEECRMNAENAAVADRLQFKVGDIMQTDISKATVVTLYLLDEVNLMLRPKLLRELPPGTRIVSHAFYMADWKADKSESPAKARNKVIYLWIIPAPVGGVWQWTAKTPAGEAPFSLDLTQEFQVVRGNLFSASTKKAPIREATLNGRELAFTSTVFDGPRQVKVSFKGTVDGDTIKGTQQWQGGSQAGAREWVAKRTPVEIAGSWRLKVQGSPEPLDGVLRLARENGQLKATYIADKDKKEIALPGFSSWGTSIYFEIPSGNEEERGPIFSGSLEGGSGTGKVSKTGWGKGPTWAAQREN